MLGIFDVINLLVFIGAAFIYPASYAAHHTEMKVETEFSIVNYQEFIFWFFFTSAIVGLYSRQYTITLLAQCTVFSLILTYTSDIVNEVEKGFDVVEFCVIWSTLFFSFGLLPLLVFQDHILGLLVSFKKFFFRRYKGSRLYEFCCYFLIGWFIRVWYEFVLYNSFESVRLGIVLYVGFHLVLPQLFS